ncbi:hypothetical protein KQX54_001582 [Cotesia glomerata]|uniref:Uncharacterized protein n=1 Tax=Cotesia glomerata TaxID=32391 RepID=A0AAV7HUF3_COTGL|nr:hypothetical protein KQX54_001582 [Cotesia glomerata]
MAKDPGTLTPVDETIDKTIGINIENGIHHQSPSQGAISKSPEPSLPMNDTETLTAEILKLDCSPNCCVACSLKLDTLLRLVNTLIMNQEHVTIHPSEPSRSSGSTHQNLLPTFPLTKLSELEKLNTTLKDNNTARTQYNCCKIENDCSRIKTITQNNHASSHGMIESTIKSWLQQSDDRIDYRSGNKTKDK